MPKNWRVVNWEERNTTNLSIYLLVRTIYIILYTDVYKNVYSYRNLPLQIFVVRNLIFHFFLNMRRSVLRQHKLCAAFVAVTGCGDKDFEEERRQNDVIKDWDGDRLFGAFLVFLDGEGLSIEGIAAGIEGERKYVAELQVPSAKVQSIGAGRDKQGM